MADNDTRSYKDMNRLTADEYYNITGSILLDKNAKESFFSAMDALYLWLMDKPIKTLFEEGSEESEIFGEIDDQFIADFEEEQQQLARDAGYDSVEEYEEAMARMGEKENQADWHLKELAEEQEDYREYDEMVAGINKRNGPAWEEYKKGFVDVEKFIEMYKTYRKLRPKIL